MPRTRWAAHVLAASLLAVHWAGPRPAVPNEARIEGTWVIESVQKDDEPDPAQVGGSLTFTAGSVTFQPRVVQFTDGAS